MTFEITMSSLNQQNLKKSFYCAILILLSFWLGVLINYYGFLYEDIKIRIELTSSDLINFKENHNSTLEEYVVPNIVHYIWFANNDRKEFSFINYISMLSAHKVQKPEKIILHCNFLPSGKWWQKVWEDIPLTIIQREKPLTVHGQTMMHAYHQGDISKMQILLEYGGIYLDYDVILINKLDPLRKFDVTLGKERSPKFIAGIIIAKPNALFLRLLYESYRDNYRPLDWDYNCARVAYEIYQNRPELLHVEPYKFTTPDWQDRKLLWDEIIEWRELYVIHLMAHLDWTDHSPESIKALRSTFGEVMRWIYYGSSDIITT